ncbi:MAG: hypothetical protein NBV67_15885 [Tagaea sp.]|nr:hypothetical protein [Tagaea sp.]
MKISWAAMAAAAMLAIAALLWDLFGRPAAPFLAATGPWPSSVCDRPPIGVRGTDRPLSGYRLYFEGMSKLVGGCHPADPDAGVATVESAFDRGLPGAFAVSFVDALIAQGRRDDAARWIGQAAIAAIEWRGFGFDTFGIPLPASSELNAEIARLRGVIGGADASAMERELAAALARDRLPIDERFALERAMIRRLFLVEPAAANYWHYRAERASSPRLSEFGTLHPNLSIASECGYMPALHELAALYFDRALDGSESENFLDTLLLYRDRARDVQDLVARARERLGESFATQDDAEFRAWFAEQSEKSCREWFARQSQEAWSDFRIQSAR